MHPLVGSLSHFPYDAADWQAFFSFGQLLLAGLALYFLVRYVSATDKLVEQARDQTEGQVAPAIVIDIKPRHFDSLGKDVRGMIALRNIGEGAAYDVRVSMPLGTGHEPCEFEHIPVLEKAVKIPMEIVRRPGARPLDIFERQERTCLLFDGASGFSVTCKSINNRTHTFAFTSAKQKADGKVHFCLANHHMDDVTNRDRLGRLWDWLVTRFRTR